MPMYQVCIQEVDKKSDRITLESGELTASPDPRPTPYIPAGGGLTQEGNHLPTPISTSPRDRRPRGRTGHAKRGLRPRGASGTDEGALPPQALSGMPSLSKP